MTDSQAYIVDVAALERDAEVFSGASDDLEHLADAVPVDLTADTFLLLPGTADLHSRFIDAATTLQAYLHDGSAELAAIAEKLDASLRIYTEAEDASADDVARVSRELDSL